MKKWLVIALSAIVIGVLVNVWLVTNRPNIGQEEIGVKRTITVTPTIKPEARSKFAVMADIHEDWEDFSKLLEKSKEREVQFVIIAGDLTSLGKKDKLMEAKKILDHSNVRYYVVPGNHDLWAEQKEKKHYFGEVFESYYKSFYENGDKFILINNGDWRGFDKAQTSWIETEVKECQKMKCVVVMHMPLNHNFSTHVMGEDNEKAAAEAKDLLILLKNNGVREIISGHLHYSGSYELEGIRTYLAGAVTKPRNTQTPRFTEFLLGSSGLDSEVIVLE